MTETNSPSTPPLLCSMEGERLQPAFASWTMLFCITEGFCAPVINCAQWHFLSRSSALNWALKKSAQQHHLGEESCTESKDTNCSWKPFISKYLSVSAKLQRSWPRAAGTLSAAASKEEEPGCLTHNKPEFWGVQMRESWESRENISFSLLYQLPSLPVPSSRVLF